METNPNSITIAKTTNEEVTLSTQTNEIEALRQQIDALMQSVKAIAEAQGTTVPDTDDETDETDVPSRPAPVSTGNSIGAVQHGEPDAHGFVPSSVTVVRPDAPPEPEPEPEPEVVVPEGIEAQRESYNTNGVTVDSWPQPVSGVRQAEDPSKYSRGRWSERPANHNVLRGLVAYTKWMVVQGNDPQMGCVIDASRHPHRSLRDWIAMDTGYTMSVSQVRTTLKRLVAAGLVQINVTGKYGKQDAYSLNETHNVNINALRS